MDKKAFFINYCRVKESQDNTEWNVYREDNYLLDASASLSAKVTRLPAAGTKILLKIVSDWSNSSQQPTTLNEIITITVGDGVEYLFAQSSECKITVEILSTNNVMFMKSGSNIYALQPKLKIYWALAN